MAGISAWRVNNVVAYDAMRESATFLTSLLLTRTAAEEIAEWRRRVLTCDGFDREAVAMLTIAIDDRIAELSWASR